MAANFYENMGVYDKLKYLSFVVAEHCKKTHLTLVHYVLCGADGKKSKKELEEFKKLSFVNDEFERNYNSIIKKYGYQLEERTDGVAVVTPDELLAFTKAYEIQKAEIKKEIDLLTSLGVSKDRIKAVENDLLVWATFHKEFYEHIQQFKE